MPAATKTKKNKTERMYFTITGEFLTNTARHTWVSDLPKKAIAILVDGANMTTEQALLTISGKKRLTGKVRIGTDDTLGWEDDNQIELFGVALDAETMVERLEKQFIDSAESRSVYSESEAGIFNEDLEADKEYKKQRLAHIAEKQKEILENLEAIYPLVGKSMKNLPITKARSLKQMRDEEIKNNPAPEVEEKEEEIIGNPDWQKTRMSFIEGYLKKQEEENKPKAITDKRYNRIFGGFYYIVPLNIEQCKEERLESGFLLPDGTFFGGRAYPYVHNDILFDLNEETDFFKDKKYTAEERSVEDAGWVKLSGSRWYFWNHDIELTKEQVQFIMDYTMEVEERDRFDMNGFTLSLQKFAGMLDGAKLDTYKMKYGNEE